MYQNYVLVLYIQNDIVWKQFAKSNLVFNLHNCKKFDSLPLCSAMMLNYMNAETLHFFTAILPIHEKCSPEYLVSNI